MAGTQTQESATPLNIILFGPFHVRLDGRPLPPLRSRTEQWLLALLALRANRPVERDWLAGTLWPESDESQAANNLRRSLWNLRQALGTQAARLRAPGRHTVQLDLTGAAVDVLAFDHAIAQATPTSLQAAVTLYGGPLLEGCTEEWVFLERQAREQAYLAALETLAERASTQGETGMAVDLLRKAVQGDPLRETAQRALMQALAASGDQAAAVLAYRDYRLLLRREFNAEPDPMTAALFHQLRQEARQRPVQSVPPAQAEARLPAAWTGLVGREQELMEIEACLQSARLVTLTGAGGVGKTRLAIEAARHAQEEFAQGAWFIDLAALTDEALVAQAVAAVLGIREEEGRSLRETLCAGLAAQQILLVLDNCEHLIDACAHLVEALLQSGPQVRILATSR
ncbi:MAG TPA: BTAD domain-containing putative transcriptional regulator, partial [Chthonomonadaceae bacterium]|nr:BTAD domain-containing putative transcriptional regulator [Chthonomonadaceae bacterium]